MGVGIDLWRGGIVGLPGSCQLPVGRLARGCSRFLVDSVRTACIRICLPDQAYLGFPAERTSFDPTSLQAPRPIFWSALRPSLHDRMRTLIAAPGPSSFEICSLACFGRSTVFVRGRRPNRNDIFAASLSASAPNPLVYGRAIAKVPISIRKR
jgi:hypothetical protein